MPPDQRPNIRSIADASGYSTATVSLALRNHPRISEATKQRIRAVAEEVGYRPNPSIARLMHHIREGKPVAIQNSIAVINMRHTRLLENASLYDSQLWIGMQSQADLLGYNIDQFWIHEPGMRPERLDSIFKARGIQALILPPMSEPGETLQLDWRAYSLVCVGYSMPRPAISRVSSNHRLSMLSCIKNCLRMGYSRIGIAIAAEFEARGNFIWTSVARWFEAMVDPAEKIPLFHGSYQAKKDFVKWLHQYRPEVVITHDQSPFLSSLQQAGLSTPGDIGIAILNLKETDGKFSGTFPDASAVGAAAVNLVTAQLMRNECGLPDNPITILTNPQWVEGSTLRQYGEPRPLFELMEKYF